VSTYIVTYNGITLSTTQIDEFEQSNVYSEDSIDVLYKRTSIVIRGVLFQCINTGQVTNAALLNTYRTTLLEPRKTLTFAIDGVNVVNITGPDANNGPLPTYVKVYKIIGNTILVDFAIECWTLACENGQSSSPGEPINPIISNRWSQTQEVDENGLSTITTNGKFVIAGSAGVNPDTLRNSIFPLTRISAGFTREKQEFTISSDETEYTYTIVDAEKFRPPTSPITTWTGTWTETMVPFPQTGTLQITIQGSKTASKTDMFTFLGQVIRSRIQINDVPTAMSITEGLSDNMLSFSMTVVLLSNQGTAKVSNSNGKVLGMFSVIPGGGGGLTTTTRIGNVVNPIDNAAQADFTTISNRGCFLTQLFVNLVNGSCDSKVSTVDNYKLTASNGNPTFYGTACVVSVVGITTDKTSDYKISAGPLGTLQAPYLWQRIEEMYDENHKFIAMPQGTAKSGGNENLVSKTISTGAAGTLRKVRFSLGRLNAPPEIPATTINGQPVDPMNIQVVMASPVTLPSGVDYLYTMYGSYEFNQPLSTNISNGNPLVVPTSPVTNQTVAPYPNAGFNPNFVG
jgi:hypothetical protein